MPSRSPFTAIEPAIPEKAAQADLVYPSIRSVAQQYIRHDAICEPSTVSAR